MRKLVRAENYNQAREFAKDQKWQQNEWEYITSPIQMKGLRGATIYLLRGYHNHPQDKEMRLEAKLQQMKTINATTDN